jgi:ABC-type ATPase with predicted acetyltransferase domain
MTEKMIKNLDEIENTQTLLETLSAEQADLSKRMSDAANDADSSALIGLAHRRNDLPIEILSAQIILERLLLRRDEERLPAFQAEAQKLAEIVAEKLKILADAQTQFNFASVNQSSAASDVSETKMTIAERKRTIEVLLREARNVKVAPASLQMHGS